MIQAGILELAPGAGYQGTTYDRWVVADSQGQEFEEFDKLVMIASEDHVGTTRDVFLLAHASTSSRSSPPIPGRLQCAERDGQIDPAEQGDAGDDLYESDRSVVPDSLKRCQGTRGAPADSGYDHDQEFVRRERDVSGGTVRIECVALKHYRHVPFLRCGPRDIGPVNSDTAARDGFETSDHPQRRRLPYPDGSDGRRNFLGSMSRSIPSPATVSPNRFSRAGQRNAGTRHIDTEVVGAGPGFAL